MSYRIRIKEHVQHRRLPDYCLEILAEVKGAWVGVPTNLPKCAIGTIDHTIETMRFMGLNSQAISGSDVPRKESVVREGADHLQQDGQHRPGDDRVH